MPELSIITINLNNKEGLDRTIRSVINQSYTDFEYIVIDGGSTDGSVDIIRQNENKIARWISEKDTGIYNAMNKGLHIAKGKYCLFLNSGDHLVDKNIIAKIFKEYPMDDILYGELIFNFGNGKQEIGKLPEKLDVFYLYNDNIWHPATFIKKALLDGISGYSEKYKIASDYDFFFNMIIVKKVKCLYLPFPIAVYDTTGISSIPGNMQQIISERSLIHQAYLDKKEIIFLNNLKKYKKTRLSRWLVNKPIATSIADIVHRLCPTIF